MRRSKDDREQETHLANHETDYKTAKTVVAFKKKPSSPRKNRKMEGQVRLTIMQDFMQNEGTGKVLFLLALNIGYYVNQIWLYGFV